MSKSVHHSPSGSQAPHKAFPFSTIIIILIIVAVLICSCSSCSPSIPSSTSLLSGSGGSIDFGSGATPETPNFELPPPNINVQDLPEAYI